MTSAKSARRLLREARAAPRARVAVLRYDAAELVRTARRMQRRLTRLEVAVAGKKPGATPQRTRRRSGQQLGFAW